LISVKHLSKSFGSKQVLHDINFKVSKGEAVGLVGPSGAGKSTTLNIIAGLLEPDSGEISVGDLVITRRGAGLERIAVPPAERGLGYVMQDTALFPNMTVYDNIGFGPDSQRLPRDEVEARVNELMSMVHVDEVKGSYPNQLSGGQQKRVALARTLAVKPNVLLMDEPLTSLHLDLKKQLMDDLRDIFDKLGSTVIYVTHDPGEAESMVDKIVRLDEGKIQETH
jgi:iron(III) transport system ATP-binding protein